MTARAKGIGGHHSAAMGKDEWITPQAVLRAIGPFDLDPCAPTSPPWPVASTRFTRRENGLLQPWSGFVFCNPPYGQETHAWLRRMVAHRNGIALVFARTETEMYFDAGWGGATSMLFLAGRLFFHHVDGRRADHNSGAPSVLLGYGDEADRRLRACALPGAFVAAWVLTGRRDHNRTLFGTA